MYLVEATDGKLRAYTIVVITEIAIITKAGPGRLMSFVVDRRSGDPIAGMLVRVWIDQKEVASKNTDQQGLVDTRSTTPSRRTWQYWRPARNEFAINTPGAWNLGDAADRNLKGYTYTDRPVYRPGDTVHFKTIVRATDAERLQRAARAGAEAGDARSADLRGDLDADGQAQ